MKNKWFFLVLALMFGFTACQKDDMREVEPQMENQEKSSRAQLGVTDQQPTMVAKNGNGVSVFRTKLSGKEEVPANDSEANGQAMFHLSRDGKELSYRLIVAKLNNVMAAHIHMAVAGENGPVVAWLYPSSPPGQLIPGYTNGVLQAGVLTNSNLVGQLAGREISDLIDLIVEGKAYVNVHTQLYPGGEIRGQIH